MFFLGQELPVRVSCDVANTYIEAQNCITPPKAAIVFIMSWEYNFYADVFARRMVVYVLWSYTIYEIAFNGILFYFLRNV